MGKASRNKNGRGQSSATATEASGSDAGRSSASGAPPSEVPPPPQPFQVPLPQGISGDALVKMMEDLVEGNITRRLPRMIEAVLKVVSASFQASIDKEVGLISKARAADAARIKNLSDGLGDLRSEVARRFDKLHMTKDPEGLRARIEAMEEDSSGYRNASVVVGNHLEDLRRRVEKLEGDTKAEIENLEEEVEDVKGRILEIGELRALIENLAKETEQAPESTRRLQHDGSTRKQASAFTEELRGSVVEVVQAAMDDFLRPSLLQDLKNSLEDTIERQIIRGIATIASQHSKFEVSLSQKFQENAIWSSFKFKALYEYLSRGLDPALGPLNIVFIQGCVDAVWTTTNSLKSLLADFQSDLSFRIPNPEEASSSGSKDQEQSSVGKDSSVQITSPEGASSSGAKD